MFSRTWEPRDARCCNYKWETKPESGARGRVRICQESGAKARDRSQSQGQDYQESEPESGAKARDPRCEVRMHTRGQGQTVV